jgi:hypothetical protein
MKDLFWLSASEVSDYSQLFHCYGPVVRQGRLLILWQQGRRDRETERNDWAPSITAHPQWPSSSNQAPFSYELINGLTHWWGQHPHNSITSQNHHQLGTKLSTHEPLGEGSMSYLKYNIWYLRKHTKTWVMVRLRDKVCFLVIIH